MNSTTVTEKIAKNSRGLLLLPHTVYSSVQLTMFKWVWNGDGDEKNVCNDGRCWNETDVERVWDAGEIGRV